MTIIPNSRLDRYTRLICVLLRSASCAGVILGASLCVPVQSARAVQFSISDRTTFTNLINTNAIFTTNGSVSSKIEGPVWIPGGPYLLFSDMANNKLKKLVPPSAFSDFYVPGPYTIFNGNILDLQERLISCQCGSNGLDVVMTTNGVVTPLVNTCNGLKFFSPNDACVKSDGSIWFTDPGWDSGLPLPPPSGSYVPPTFQTGLYVYRFYESNGNATATVMTTNVAKPNGICFSPNETKLYVSDNGSGSSGRIIVFNVTSSNTLTGSNLFCTVSQGIADGLRCDVNGNLWAASGDGVEIYAPDGHLIGKIVFSSTSNLCFGGSQYKTIYMTAAPNVCSFPVLTAGAVSNKKLTVGASGTNVCVSWPSPSTGFALQSAASVSNGAVWSNVTNTVGVTNGLNQLGLSPTNAAVFFRLLLN